MWVITVKAGLGWEEYQNIIPRAPAADQAHPDAKTLRKSQARKQGMWDCAFNPASLSSAFTEPGLYTYHVPGTWDRELTVLKPCHRGVPLVLFYQN